MLDFKRYQIDCLLKKFVIFDKFDFDFVHYCDSYYSSKGNLPIDLYNHLNILFWRYHD